MRVYSAIILALVSATAAAQIPATDAQPASALSSYNPAISVILNGSYAHFSRDPSDYRIPGFVMGEETGPGTDGLSLGESELVLSANADDLVRGYMTVALTPENEAEVEEAYVQSIGLPYGLTLKAGRFLSGLGYMNEQHPHVWDFIDTALPYRALLANQYGDDGVQVRWLAPTDLFIEFGAEAMRGESFPSAGAQRDGSGAYAGFLHIGGDVGASHSWRAGVSHLQTRAMARESEDLVSGDTLSFTGESRMSIVDFIWKWAPDGNARERNWKVQGEYFRRDEAGEYTNSVLVEEPYDAAQSGWYLQSVYQFVPRWRLGLRYDALKADVVPAAFVGTTLDSAGHSPRRTSAMLDFSNSEFTRVRAQYNRDQAQPQVDHQFFLQYIVSIGAHGAHRF